ncbi:amino acid ABC transporter substrate-binding protein [Niveibacterium terrae]|uniref:amino acid ABC transporter substrate-binding protein n=1 Tax=Niveibacterium terrae TaxID=3373598 RepID=UPI003A93FCE3
MTLNTLHHALCAALLAALPLTVASAQPDTLEKIRQTHTINVGIRSGARPFSFFDEQKQPAGYTVDLCQKVLTQIRKELKLGDLKVSYVPVSAEDRIPKLQNGTIDLECGSTTNTKARTEKVDFSYSTFVSSIKLAARVGSGITTPASLAGKTIALTRGTTAEKLFTQLRASEIRNINLVYFPTNTESVKALQAGKAQAFAGDDVLIAGLLSTLPDGKQFAIVGDGLSVGPYAIMMRKGDKALRELTDKTLASVFASGEINAIYKRWFENDKIKIPMSALTREAITRPSHDSGIARLLGYSL